MTDDNAIQQLHDAALVALRDPRTRAYVKTAARRILDALCEGQRAAIRHARDSRPLAATEVPILGCQLVELALRAAMHDRLCSGDRAAAMKAAAGALVGCAPTMRTAELAVAAISAAAHADLPYAELVGMLRPWARMRGPLGAMVSAALRESPRSKSLRSPPPSLAATGG